MKSSREKMQRRAQRTRTRLKKLANGRPRLSVFRSNKNIYAQVIDDIEGKVVASASTVDPKLRKSVKNGGNVAAATEVGKLIAENAKAAGVTKVAFDRSGFKYHGRIKALADAAREQGLQF